MKYFKIKPGRNKVYEVVKEEYIRATGNKEPYTQKKNGNESHFAVCPRCDNPVQLIGLYSLKQKPRPHAKHTGKDVAIIKNGQNSVVSGLPRHNAAAYNYCPWASHRKYVDMGVNIVETTEREIQLYEFIKSQFDRIVYIIEKELDMLFSVNFTRDMLTSFITNKGYLYPALSFDNAAWIVAYRGLIHQNIFKQCVKIDSPLYNSLRSKCKSIKFESNCRAGYSRISSQENSVTFLRANFLNHKISDDGYEEKIEFEVFTKKGKGDKTSDFPTVFKKDLHVDPVYFSRLSHMSRDNINRNQKLLNIADELMPPLK